MRAAFGEITQNLTASSNKILETPLNKSGASGLKPSVSAAHPSKNSKGSENKQASKQDVSIFSKFSEESKHATDKKIRQSKEASEIAEVSRRSSLDKRRRESLAQALRSDAS